MELSINLQPKKPFFAQKVAPKRVENSKTTTQNEPHKSVIFRWQLQKNYNFHNKTIYPASIKSTNPCIYNEVFKGWEVGLMTKRNENLLLICVIIPTFVKLFVVNRRYWGECLPSTVELASTLSEQKETRRKGGATAIYTTYRMVRVLIWLYTFAVAFATLVRFNIWFSWA